MAEEQHQPDQYAGPFDYRSQFGLPKTTPAWCARIIIQDGYFDFVNDRCCAVGTAAERKEIMDLLNQPVSKTNPRTPFQILRDEVNSRLNKYAMPNNGKGGPYDLVHENGLRIKGQASWGYLYVCVYKE